MSAGPAGGGGVNRDPARLAPAFRAAVQKAVDECNRRGLDAFVYEGFRSQELQKLYYARGRTVIPPHETVTNAATNLYSWHGYGLAVDVISQAHEWSVPDEWFGKVAAVFKQFNCKWGGDWKTPDLPHFQWGPCKPSPSELARQLIRTQGVEAVWKAVGAW
ncbi:MAG: hypothetical protein JWM27_3585 [Gemmatimonadetes bacterium]|nr:hypothetical protein [Gemmatimonadota bacterium]